jgi:hypothetical protein
MERRDQNSSMYNRPRHSLTAPTPLACPTKQYIKTAALDHGQHMKRADPRAAGIFFTKTRQA